MNSSGQTTTTTTSVTRSTKHRFSHQWIIEDFSFFVDQPDSTSRTKISSTRFAPPEEPKLQFYMSAYPNGEAEEHTGHLSLYLFYECKAVPEKKEVTVRYWICLIDADGGKQNILRSTRKLTSYGDGYGWHKFIPQSDLEVKQLLPDNKLTIFCEIELISDRKSEDSLQQVQTDQHLDLTKSICSKMSDLLDSGTHSDITLVVRGKQLRAHKAILAAHSPVFTAMFEHDFKEKQENQVTITDVSPEVAQDLLRFIYGGKLDPDCQNLEELLFAADKYNIALLKKVCEKKLAHRITTSSVSKLAFLADLHSAEELKQCCLKFIADHTKQVLATDSWKELAKSEAEFMVALLAELLVLKTEKLSVDGGFEFV